MEHKMHMNINEQIHLTRKYYIMNICDDGVLLKLQTFWTLSVVSVFKRFNNTTFQRLESVSHHQSLSPNQGTSLSIWSNIVGFT
jgi:hypothetical protein